MSRRTAEASKAIAIAWENEQKRINEGKGTRDWTIEQQQDILERGKAYDENGKAFEGQHMRSVAEHPECQGDPNNIQFLTRDEHLEAHDGDWKNPSNWYYDPVAKTKHDFGDGPVIPCTVFELSQSVLVPNTAVVGKVEDDIPKEHTVKKPSGTRAPPVQSRPCVQSTSRPTRTQTLPPPAPKSMWDAVRKRAEVVYNGAKKVIKDAGKYAWNHKGEIGAGLLFLGGIVLKAKYDSENNSTNNNSDHDSIDYSTFDSDDSSDNETYNNYDIPNSRSYPNERSSPYEHNVSGYERQQNGKTVHVNPYKRGGKNSNT